MCYLSLHGLGFLLCFCLAVSWDRLNVVLQPRLAWSSPCCVFFHALSCWCVPLRLACYLYVIVLCEPLVVVAKYFMFSLSFSSKRIKIEVICSHCRDANLRIIFSKSWSSHGEHAIDFYFDYFSPSGYWNRSFFSQGASVVCKHCF